MDIELRLERLQSEVVGTDTEDKIIQDYIPFIISKVSKITSRYIETENDETYLVGLEAFHEAMEKFDKSKGRFLSFAEMVIRNRITDFLRQQEKHRGNVHYDQMDDLAHNNSMEEAIMLKEEVFAFKLKLAMFGLTPDELVDASPKQEKTIRKVTDVGREASKHEDITNKMYETKKLPMARILDVVKTTKKILKTYRNYIVAVIIVHVEKYEMIDKFLLSKEER